MPLQKIGRADFNLCDSEHQIHHHILPNITTYKCHIKTDSNHSSNTIVLYGDSRNLKTKKGNGEK